MLSPQNNAKVSTQNQQNPVQNHQSAAQNHQTPVQNGQNLTPDQNLPTHARGNRLPTMRDHQTPLDTIRHTPEQEQDAEVPESTPRRSRRAVMRPKHLVIDPNAKVYQEEEYAEEDDEDEDLPSSS